LKRRHKKKLSSVVRNYQDLLAQKSITMVGHWKGVHEDTMHYCEKHNRQYLARPGSLMRENVGLRCCKREKMRVHGKKRMREGEKRLLNYLEQLEEKDLSLAGQYNGMLKDAEFTCHIHRQTHQACPANIISGKRLVCCRDSNKSLDGINNLVYGDKFRTDFECLLYAFRLVGYQDFVKIGITIDYSNRSSSHGFGIYPAEPDLLWSLKDRRDARFIEEAIKMQLARYQRAPKKLIEENWAGISEVFQAKIQIVEQVINVFVSEIEEFGTWKFAENYCPLNSKQLKECVLRQSQP